METLEKTISKEIKYQGKILNLRKDVVELPNGTEATREVVEHNGGVSILALDNQDNIYLVSQFRYPHNSDVLELPAGKLEANEIPLDCAIRELKEETGFTAEKIDFLCKFLPTPAYSCEINYIYFATGLSVGEQSLDNDEFLNVIKIPFSEALSKVMSGEIIDAKTIIGILKIAQLKKDERFV